MPFSDRSSVECFGKSQGGHDIPNFPLPPQHTHTTTNKMCGHNAKTGRRLALAPKRYSESHIVTREFGTSDPAICQTSSSIFDPKAIPGSPVHEHSRYLTKLNLKATDDVSDQVKAQWPNTARNVANINNT